MLSNTPKSNILPNQRSPKTIVIIHSIPTRHQFNQEDPRQHVPSREEVLLLALTVIIVTCKPLPHSVVVMLTIAMPNAFRPISINPRTRGPREGQAMTRQALFRDHKVRITGLLGRVNHTACTPKAFNPGQPALLRVSIHDFQEDLSKHPTALRSLMDSTLRTQYPRMRRKSGGSKRSL